MTPLLSLHDRITSALDHAAPVVIPSLARLVFAGTLLVYYWNAATTKLGDDGFLFGLFNPSFGAYGQILPRVFEAQGYDPSALSLFATLFVIAATLAEFVLPVLILVGLATRLAALGMITVVIAQSWVDIHGHNLGAADIGGWFDGIPGSLIADQRAFWLFLLVVIVLRGAGPLSVDALIGRRYSSASLTALSQPR